MIAIPKWHGYSTSYKKKELPGEDRFGNPLHRTFKGKIAYQWSHKDKLARVEWQGPNPQHSRAENQDITN